MSPKRIQRHRSKGWRMPDNALYVGRPTKWGNPFPIVGTWIVWTAVALGFKADADGRRRAALLLYRAWLTRTLPTIEDAPDEGGAISFANGVEVPTSAHVQGLAGVVASMTEAPALPVRPDGLWELRGKDLACWCPLDQPCHADVLLELANAGER